MYCAFELNAKNVFVSINSRVATKKFAARAAFFFSSIYLIFSSRVSFWSTNKEPMVQQWDAAAVVFFHITVVILIAIDTDRLLGTNNLKSEKKADTDTFSAYKNQ